MGVALGTTRRVGECGVVAGHLEGPDRDQRVRPAFSPEVAPVGYLFGADATFSRAT